MPDSSLKALAIAVARARKRQDPGAETEARHALIAEKLAQHIKRDAATLPARERSRLAALLVGGGAQ